MIPTMSIYEIRVVIIKIILVRLIKFNILSRKIINIRRVIGIGANKIWISRVNILNEVSSKSLLLNRILLILRINIIRIRYGLILEILRRMGIFSQWNLRYSTTALELSKPNFNSSKRFSQFFLFNVKR